MMRYVFFLFVFLVGTIYWVSTKHNRFEERKPINSGNEVKNHVRLIREKETRVIDESFIEYKKEDDNYNESILRIHSLSDELRILKGKELFNKLEGFWLSCKVNHTCDYQLDELKEQLPDSLFNLLSSFEVLRDEWLISSQGISKDIHFLEKIEQVRQQYENVWGEYTELLFEDEFQYYNFRAESISLQQVTPSEYIEQIDILFNQFEEKRLDSYIKSNSAKFDYAIDNMPDSFSNEERESLVKDLSLIYLTEQERADFNKREMQIKTQNHEVETYQHQLSELKARLDSLRITEYSELSDKAWQDEYQRRIEEFRIEFFDYQ
ncbi:hypothetical protein UB34_08860 [Photobacterium leiognathi]|uniref:Chromosome partitioning protein ParA n=1 Tax=Photobacterium leiognathi TaxID=553611 RepID=A0A2T3MB73_PHOLE|nr:hypothetical protein UB34_08860 [Photobacterium leiognathi]PSV90493.1 hypothetical protein CTM89_09195 [Photobacterium leiognathi]